MDKPSTTRYAEKHVGLFSLKEILPRTGKEDQTFLIDGISYTLSTKEKQRYLVFRKYPYCRACGIKAKYLVICIQPNNPMEEFRTPYLKMYAHTGALFTIDHILPKKYGGGNNISNLQTMCSSCNRKKGSNPNWKYYVEGVTARRRLKRPDLWVNVRKIDDFTRRKSMGGRSRS